MYNFKNRWIFLLGEAMRAYFTSLLIYFDL
jgi:hypothetical protein